MTVRKRKPIESLWRGLSEIGITATRAWWIARCGTSGAAAIDPFLKPTAEIATWFPDPDDHTRQMRVIPDPKTSGRFLAVSKCEPRREDMALTKADLTLYRLDIQMFAKALAAALGLSATKMPRAINDRTIRLGVLVSHGVSIYLIVTGDPVEFVAALDAIRVHDAGATALVTPSSSCIPAHLKPKVDEGIIQHAGLRELIEVANDGRLLATCNIADYFSPAQGIQTGPPYRTWPLEFPPNPSWKDVEMVFRGAQEIWIRFGSAERTFRFDEIIGFMRRTADKGPNEAWSALHEIAIAGGRLRTPDDEKEQFRVRQNRGNLNEVLGRFFGIRTEPVKADRRHRTWGVGFQISSRI